MQLLATNVLIWQDVKPGFKWGVSVLPIGLMFAAFVPTIAISMWLAVVLTGPATEQSVGLLWLGLFLTTMVILMLAGYALGWVLNALIARVYFRWPAEKIRDVFLESRIPAEWRQAGIPITASTGTSPRRRISWAVTRQKGRWHFVLVRGVLGWGAAMFVGMGLIPVLIHRQQASWPYFVWQATLWALGGALFGLAMWSWSEWVFKKQSGNDASQEQPVDPEKARSARQS